jgi:3-hydroxyisobutyrate dehydrogenase-like beta-hydroxyacid dehydrogenase
MPHIAMVGLGHMGEPIARNLLNLDRQLHVYNRTPAKAERLVAEGAVLAQSPGHAAEGAEIVVSSLLDDASMMSLLIDPQGLLGAMQSGAVHVCTATISPGCAAELQRLHHEAGQRFVAAPVIGRPPAAAAGALIVLAAGSDDALTDARHVIEGFSGRIIEAGSDAAQAYTMKLAVNFFIVSMIELFGELFAFTAKGEIEPEPMVDLISTMLGHAAIKEYLARVSEQRFGDAGFEAITGLKDVTLMLQRSGELRAPLPYANLIRDRLLTAVAEGQDTMDWSVIAALARRQAGL